MRQHWISLCALTILSTSTDAMNFDESYWRVSLAYESETSLSNPGMAAIATFGSYLPGIHPEALMDIEFTQSVINPAQNSTAESYDLAISTLSGYLGYSYYLKVGSFFRPRIGASVATSSISNSVRADLSYGLAYCYEFGEFEYFIDYTAIGTLSHLSVGVSTLF